MSGKVAYILRTDRGSRLESIRLLGARRDESWQPHTGPAGGTTSTVPGSTLHGQDQGSDAPLWDPGLIEAAAHWLRDRLSGQESAQAPALDLLCLDAEGGACGWVSTPSTELDVVSIVARPGGPPIFGSGPGAFGGGGGASGESFNTTDDRAPMSALAFYAGELGEASVQPLGGRGDGDDAAADSDADAAPSRSSRTPGATGTASKNPLGMLSGLRRAKNEAPAQPMRLAALAVTDAPAKLLLDALDAQNVSVASVISIWHALALAWDPSSPQASASPAARSAASDPLDSARTCAILALDPRGRLLWCWSRAGELLACGSLRLAHARPTPTSTPTSNATNAEEDASTALAASRGSQAAPEYWTLGPAEAARLTTEWIGWSTQLGVAPARIAVLLTQNVRDADASAFGKSLAGGWAGATLDLSRVDDPIGQTLSRLALHHADSGPPTAQQRSSSSLGELSNRPGQGQRRMVHAVAAAVLGASVLMGGLAFRLYRDAAKVREQATQTTGTWRDTLEREYPRIANRPGTIDTADILKEEIKKRQTEADRNREEPSQPVLAEIETLSLVLADPTVHVARVNLDYRNGITIDVEVEGVAAMEQLKTSLENISGSAISEWRLGRERNLTDNRIGVTLTGRWRQVGGGSGSGGSPALASSAGGVQ